MPKRPFNRRHFFKLALASSVATMVPGIAQTAIFQEGSFEKPKVTKLGSNTNVNPRLGPRLGPRLKLSLNAYSFNQQLRDGKMDLFDLLDYERSRLQGLSSTGNITGWPFCQTSFAEGKSASGHCHGLMVVYGYICVSPIFSPFIF